MNLELVRDEYNETTGGIPGRLYVDGQFFGYTLENIASAIPTGVFSLFDRFSPKFNAFKLAIDVPGRQYIMFHGGNVPEQFSGCIGIAKNRDSYGNIQGDLSETLYNITKQATEAGNIVLTIRNKTNWPLIIAIGAAAAFLILK
jgi:hypothetical protein